MRLVLDNLVELAEIHEPQRQQRHDRLAAAASEAARQLRAGAERAGIALQISPDLPDIEMAAAAVELCLVNYISNAIKNADRSHATPVIDVRGRVIIGPEVRPDEVIVEVADNGLGVPEAARAHLFTRFFRAHDKVTPTIEGTGLGLTIIRETVEALAAGYGQDAT